MKAEKSGTFTVIKAKTEKAVYIGKLSGKTALWKGIRYGKAPVGELRFAPPMEATRIKGRNAADHRGGYSGAVSADAV